MLPGHSICAKFFCVVCVDTTPNLDPCGSRLRHDSCKEEKGNRVPLYWWRERIHKGRIQSRGVNKLQNPNRYDTFSFNYSNVMIGKQAVLKGSYCLNIRPIRCMCVYWYHVYVCAGARLFVWTNVCVCMHNSISYYLRFSASTLSQTLDTHVPYPGDRNFQFCKHL